VPNDYHGSAGQKKAGPSSFQANLRDGIILTISSRIGICLGQRRKAFDRLGFSTCGVGFLLPARCWSGQI